MFTEIQSWMIWGSVEVAPASTEEFLPPVPRVGGKLRLQIIPCSVLEEKKTMGVIANLGHVHVSNWLPRTSIETQFACLAAQEHDTGGNHQQRWFAHVCFTPVGNYGSAHQCPTVPWRFSLLPLPLLTHGHSAHLPPPQGRSAARVRETRGGKVPQVHAACGSIEDQF